MENNLPAYPGDVIASVPISGGGGGGGQLSYISFAGSTQPYREYYPSTIDNNSSFALNQAVRELQAAVQALREEVKQLKEIHNNRLPVSTIPYRKMNI